MTSAETASAPSRVRYVFRITHPSQPDLEDYFSCWSTDEASAQTLARTVNGSEVSVQRLHTIPPEVARLLETMAT